MNAHQHALLSVKKRGGAIEDYYPIHFFMDSTKELCSDNRHRILHNLWGIRRILIPIFGPAITNSEGKKINLKDLCEQDHILPDYSNKFIPTLADFIESLEELNDKEQQLINDLHCEWDFDAGVVDLLLSPLSITGQLKSLLLTHNSWFINSILPKVFPECRATIQAFPISVSTVFEKMRFAIWMDNGKSAAPRSAKMIKDLL
ncbi:MAG: hypothetical protein KTR30_35035 [Saprospiraceae bacterium]|nr:hypothetical protein [Saprospiraceae bacterium]